MREVLCRYLGRNRLRRTIQRVPNAPEVPSSNEPNNASCNLYVLNLPLDASTSELQALFAQYGDVTHCVILAMLDTQARRRGFINMSTPASARAALNELNGRAWHGYPLEVSYALVQRGGPFDAPTGDGMEEDTCSECIVELSGLLPAATLDAEEVRALVEPHAAAAVVQVACPAHLVGLATYTARITLASERAARAVCAALNGVTVNGQSLACRVTKTERTLKN